MMWSTIANLKENLNKIAQDVHDDQDVEEFGIYGSLNGHEATTVSDRRNSHSFSHPKSVPPSLLSNGVDSPSNPEIEQYKAEIKKLQESEAEIKALSKNYAALLKEKEDQISRLNKENGLLKQNQESTRNESLKASINGTNALKGSSDQSPPNRQHKFTTQGKNQHFLNPLHSGVSKLDGISNRAAHLTGKEREVADVLEENNWSRAAVQANPEMKLLQRELEKEHVQMANIQLKLLEEEKLNESLQKELKSVKLDRDKTSTEMREMHSELNEKLSAIKRLQMELNRREEEGTDDILEDLKRLVATLEKENANLKMEKNELKAALEMIRMSPNKISLDAPEALTKHQPSSNEKVDASESSLGREEMAQSLQKLDKEIKETRCERDKALQELARLKQHLLEKESEESEKMDEDGKIIEELRQSNEYQRAQILHLEKALKQAIASQEEFKMYNNNEIQKLNEIIDDLNKKLASCLSTVDAKDVELLNLQTALGQYYAEIEAKEHVEADLARAREELAKMYGLLKELNKRSDMYILDQENINVTIWRQENEEANNQSEASNREKEEILSKLSLTERTLADWKVRVNKLEEDNAKLRRAVEQSMTRLNRMSMDSDYLVDRRIVIKLLVTYFQRNHSKEVLDLMVRMLGFSDEDKQRIGVAQHGSGKGVVRGVLGLSGRLVGGILRGSSAVSRDNLASENQSFADLWVDFLLKETEEREKREAMDDSTRVKEDLHKNLHKNPNSAISSSAPDHRSTATDAASPFARASGSPSQNPGYFQSNLGLSENSDTEFSTVPLTSTGSNFHSSRAPQKY